MSGDLVFELIDRDREHHGSSISGGGGCGSAAVYAVTGSGGLHLTVADVRWPDGARDVRAIDRHQSPPRFDRLLHGGRLAVDRHPPDLLRIDLRQLRMKDALWSNLKQATVPELSAGAGGSIVQLLRRFGAAAIGTRGELLGDGSTHRNKICATFPSAAEDVPIAAYVATRVGPLQQRIMA